MPETPEMLSRPWREYLNPSTCHSFFWQLVETVTFRKLIDFPDLTIRNARDNLATSGSVFGVFCIYGAAHAGISKRII
jgi:hypothetical protein